MQLEPTERRGSQHRRAWLVAALVIALVAAVHGVALGYAWEYAAIAPAALASLILLKVLLHLGVLVPAFAVLRSLFRRGPR